MNLVLIRHGKSVWNLENKFTGWYDIELSRDWGILYRLKKDWLREAPEYDYRIVSRSTNRTWEEVLNEDF